MVDPLRGSDGERTRSVEEIFTKRVYATASIFIIVASLQIIILSQWLNKDGEILMIGFFCTLASVGPIALLTLAPRLRRFVCVSWTLSCIFVELSVVGTAMAVIDHTVYQAVLSLLGAVALIVILCILGAMLPQKILPGEISIFVSLVLFGLACIVIMGTFMATYHATFKRIFFFFLAGFQVFICLYNIQIIHGRRFKVPDYDYVYCATMLYLHYFLFFVDIIFCFWTRHDPVVPQE